MTDIPDAEVETPEPPQLVEVLVPGLPGVQGDKGDKGDKGEDGIGGAEVMAAVNTLTAYLRSTLGDQFSFDIGESGLWPLAFGPGRDGVPRPFVWIDIKHLGLGGTVLPLEALRVALGMASAGEYLVDLPAGVAAVYGWGSDADGAERVAHGLSETGKIIGELLTPTDPDFACYVEGGKLKATGGTAGDRVINEDADKTWITAHPVRGSIQGVYETDGVRTMVRVSPLDGSMYPDGAVNMLISLGQSESLSQGGGGDLVWVVYEFGDRLRMLATTWNDVRSGIAPTAGASDDPELPLDTWTGLTALRGKVSPSGNHGTTTIEAAVRRMAARAAASCGGWVPDLIAAATGEGGENIEALLEDGRSHNFQNRINWMQKAAEYVEAEGKRLVVPRLDIIQGISGAGNDNVGELQNLLLSQIQARLHAGLPGQRWVQTEPVYMLAGQPSAFFTNSLGAASRSILRQHEATLADGGRYLLTGPLYPWMNYFNPADYVHYLSQGSRRIGEFYDLVWAHFKRTGAWDVLRVVEGGAVKTSPTQMRFTFTEAPFFSTETVMAIANRGLEVPGVAITNMTIDGVDLVVTNSGSNAAATTWEIGLEGQSGSTRVLSKTARTNIRSADSYGLIGDNEPAYKHLCHQSGTFA